MKHTSFRAGESAWPRQAARAVILVGVMLIAGAALTAQRASGAGTPGGVAASTPTPPATGVVLFADDFATFSGRWRESTSAKAVVAYRDQALRLRVVSPGVAAWSVPDFHMPPGEFRVEGAIRFHAGGDDALFGFALDYAADDRFLAVLISRGGDLRALRREGDGWLDVPLDESAPDAGGRLPAMVTVRADVRRDALTIYVDETLRGTVSLKQALAGDIFGVIAKAGRGYVDVSFDDITVTALTSAEEQTP
ncbi:MAG: hypothetical protein M5U29_06225 [Anaerolineae bacterium]|nr:hypothetical protein [Anaerolineae bacterium]